MPNSNSKLMAAVEDYLDDLRKIKASGAGTAETSYYTPLNNLLNAVGGSMKPKVFCISQLAQQGADHPDFGLFAAKQVSKGQPKQGQLPESGVVEVKPATDDAWLTVDSAQVSKYWGLYRLVLVTNTRDFVLLGEDANGKPAKFETFRLAASAADFDKKLQTSKAFANEFGPALAEYLCRALSHRATLAEPRDLARLLASYARDGLARVEASGDAPSLNAVRSALEEALGVKFEGDKGAAFFRSTLVQTLFYGMFSAWVLWARQSPSPTGNFNWREAVWHLRAPVIRALFQQLSDPGKLQPLGLVEVLDWTAAALDRVNRESFFAKFNEGEAVPYFYEPFLEEFDPALRKQLGVWYTPPEVVSYMVARVDRALKDDLGIEDGLAGENVYVLDPCCGTGAYLAETLRRIAANLDGKGLGALAGEVVKKAATERVFGFEIMPAPFVVSHLQVGLTMQDLDAPLSDDPGERAGVFLTNALTGWEKEESETELGTQLQMQLIPELKDERDRAEQVKQDTPVLVILGNPPYNGFAGMAVGEEAELKDAYKYPTKVKKPEGQGLNDLYVRFFRMAERRIAEKTGRGIVCFISNYSWLEGLSFTGMRERYLEAFDAIHIDCLNGDKYKTGKTTPDGRPDPSIFSTPGDLVGIQVGTAIATLIRKADHIPAESVGFRHLWGQTKLAQLAGTAETEAGGLYDPIEPSLPLGLPFTEVAVTRGWSNWPSLPDLFPTSFPGVKTSRDSFLVDVDEDRLQARVADYFNAELSHGEIARLHPTVMNPAARYDPVAVRDTLLKRNEPHPNSGIIRYAYRPFDSRWLYWEADTKLLDEKRSDFRHNVIDGNLWLSSAQHLRKGSEEPQTCFARGIGSLHLIERGANMFPAYLREEGLLLEAEGDCRRPNLTPAAQAYLDRSGLGVEDLFHHALAVLHDPAYREANAGALRMEWPRIPLPGWPDGNDAGADDELRASAARGRELAALLDPETPVPGVTAGTLCPELAAIAVPSTGDDHNMAGDDFALTAGWGHFGTGEAVMPGTGHAVERQNTAAEREAMGDAADILGNTTVDVHLNDDTLWRNVPAAVWDYKLGGYQVLKKWLSYREQKVLGRNMRHDEVRHFTDTARRIAAILRLTRP